MARIASTVTVRWHLHAVPVAVGLIVLLTVVLFTKTEWM
ncbi:MAG: hypothetical protein ACJAW2_001522 [Shewanella sp.]|jgi:hypothetical protein